MINKALFLLLFTTSILGFSQEIDTDSIQIKKAPLVSIKGKIVNGYDKQPLEGAHIFNMNSIRGAITNSEGLFEVEARANDTIFLSHLGFQSVKIKITNDLTKGNPLEIALYEEAELIQEVKVKNITLVGVLEIDAKNVPTDKYTRIHINGLPQTYEVGKPRTRSYSSPVAAIFHPVDFMYNMFGEKPKQLKKLKSMRDEDEVREMLNTKVNRDLMLEYMELSPAELEELLDECNYSEYFIKTANDIQVIEAVIECYENYKALKKGSTKRN